MCKLSATVLAVVLVFFGTMALSHVPRSFTVHEDVVLERVTKMNKSVSNHGNAVEVDGIRFETLVPEQTERK